MIVPTVCMRCTDFFSCSNGSVCVCVYTYVLILHVSIDKHVFSGSAGVGRAGTNDTSNHSDRHQRVTACQTHSAHTLLQHARPQRANDLGFP